MPAPIYSSKDIAPGEIYEDVFALLNSLKNFD